MVQPEERRRVPPSPIIGPRAGGTEIVHEKREILVITPQSPLGEQLLGKKQGDQPQLTFGGTKQETRIVSVV